MKYIAEGGKIRLKENLSQQLIFCDGRLYLSYDEKGVSRLCYFFPDQRGGNQILFKRGIFHAFRPIIGYKGKQYQPEYKNCEIMPYGLTSEFRIEGEVFRLGVYAIHESLFFEMNGAEDSQLILSFYESTQFIPSFQGDYDGMDFGWKRSWSDWTEENGVFSGWCTERRKKDERSFYTGIFSGGTYEVKKYGVNTRYDLCARPGRSAFFGITFGLDQKKMMASCKEMTEKYAQIKIEQEKRYRAVAKNMPVLKTSQKGLDDFIKLAPMYHESLKVKERAGCIRAKNTRYWVWGWDSLISSISPLLWGDANLVKEELAFFEATADRNKGLLHACNYDNTVASYSQIPAQGVYIVAAYEYWKMTGDVKTIQKHYKFIMFIYRKIRAAESKVAGLYKGSSLFPDYPKCLKETGQDISLYNNTICYGAMRALEELAAAVHDEKTRAEVSVLNEQTRKNFNRCFYDEKRGYYVNSVDAETGEKRDCINICGFFWDCAFEEELIGDKAAQLWKYISEKGISKAGIRTIPLEEDAYDADANQLHCWWPAVEEVVMRLAKTEKENQFFKDWMNRIAYWTGNLICPEGISYRFETETPETDGWNCEPGSWQAYTIRKWYAEVIGGICGIGIRQGSLVFDTPVINYRLKRLHVFGCKVNIACEGEGAICEVRLNGEPVSGVEIKAEQIKQRRVADIKIFRK